MIKYDDLSTLFSSLDITCEEYNIESEEDIVTPYMCYLANSSNTFGADGINYLDMLNVKMILINDIFDLELQESIETILANNDVRWSKDFDFDTDNRVYTTTYEFEVLQ